MYLQFTDSSCDLHYWTAVWAHSSTIAGWMQNLLHFLALHALKRIIKVETPEPRVKNAEMIFPCIHHIKTQYSMHNGLGLAQD